MELSLLAAVGFTLILQRGKVFDSLHVPLRRQAREVSSWLYTMLACSLCLGFWAGAAIDAALVQPDAMLLAAGVGAAVGTVVLATHWLVHWTDVRMVDFVSAGILGALALGLLAPWFITCLWPDVPYDRSARLVEVALAGLRSAACCLAADMLVSSQER